MIIEYVFINILVFIHAVYVHVYELAIDLFKYYFQSAIKAFLINKNEEYFKVLFVFFF